MNNQAHAVSKMTALTLAAAQGYVPIVTMLLDRGANIDHVDKCTHVV